MANIRDQAFVIEGPGGVYAVSLPIHLDGRVPAADVRRFRREAARAGHRASWMEPTVAAQRLLEFIDGRRAAPQV